MFSVSCWFVFVISQTNKHVIVVVVKLCNEQIKFSHYEDYQLIICFLNYNLQII